MKNHVSWTKEHPFGQDKKLNPSMLLSMLFNDYHKHEIGELKNISENIREIVIDNIVFTEIEYEFYIKEYQIKLRDNRKELTVFEFISSNCYGGWIHRGKWCEKVADIINEAEKKIRENYNKLKNEEQEALDYFNSIFN